MDAATIQSLAANAVALISPYLANAASQILPKAAEDLYAAIKNRFSQKPAAEEVIQDLEQAPSDEDTQAALRAQLKKIMAEDEEFAAQVSRLVDQARDTGSTGTVHAAQRGVAAGQDISGNVFTGDVRGPVSVGIPAPAPSEDDD